MHFLHTGNIFKSKFGLRLGTLIQNGTLYAIVSDNDVSNTLLASWFGILRNAYCDRLPIGATVTHRL